MSGTGFGYKAYIPIDEIESGNSGRVVETQKPATHSNCLLWLPAGNVLGFGASRRQQCLFVVHPAAVASTTGS